MWFKIKNDKLYRAKFVTLILFICIITALAWQSDDAYHAYVMAKNLVLGNGFVYNVGERVTASSCPLFTLIIALGYLVFRKMFLVSLLICVIFSSLAYHIVVKYFCKSVKQVFFAFFVLVSSTCFISYTTSGLENCLLFFLTALFLKTYFGSDKYGVKELFIMALLVALIATTRMDAVLLVVPMVLYAYLAKRNNVSFIKAVGIGVAGLLPFVIWELFSLFYYGFLVPNTAFVKLGTGIPEIEYIKRGLMYLFTSAMCDVLLIAIPVLSVLVSLIVRKWKNLYCSLGVVLYIGYVIYIGGDFMLGRHFTVMFLMSLISLLDMNNREEEASVKKKVIEKVAVCLAAAGIVINMASPVITSQYLFGTGNSPIADERAGYFKYTSLFNNTLSVLKTGKMVIRDAWNEKGITELRDAGYTSGIIRMVPGITIYYNSDMYLNDQYALGDPFLSKLPAVREENWRIGHMYREVPEDYYYSIYTQENCMSDEKLHEYLDVIWLITRGDLTDGNRIKAIIDFNLGKYDYLLEDYTKSLGID